MLLLEALLELLYPSKCVLCGKLLDGNETNLCGSCRRERLEARFPQERGSR